MTAVRTPSVLDCRDLRVDYGAEPVLAGVDLVVEAGEVVALLGLNGAGKTTLMRVVLGMRRLLAGRVRVLGHDIAWPATGLRSCWSRVGHLVDSPALYPELTVRENLTAAARLQQLAADDAEHAVGAIIDDLGLSRWADRRANTLSMGNRQRVALARALVHHPTLLVLDEPANGLDPAGMVLLRDIIAAAAAGGAGVLVSSHHLDEVCRIADRADVLHRGRLVGRLDPAGHDVERDFFAMVYDADLADRAVAE